MLGTIISNSKLIPKTQALLNIDNEKLKHIIEIIHKVRNGEVVNLKKLHLPSTNPLVIQNGINRYKKGELSAEEILINSKNYSQDFLHEVFNDFVQSASGEKVMQYYKDFLTKESLMLILDRMQSEENPLR